MKTANWLLALLGGIFIGLSVGFTCTNSGHNAPTQSSDTITIHDTVTERYPIAKNCSVIRYVREAFPVVDTCVKYVDHYVTDSVMVEIPISQKEYVGENYQAWVSGYQPNLDSISVFNTSTIITQTLPVGPKRWGIGIQAGVGFTWQKEVRPYIGVGISYNLFNF